MLNESVERVLAGEREERLLTLFFVLYKTARIVDTANNTFKNQIDNFYKQFGLLTENEPNLALKVISDRFFINDKMVRFNRNGVSGADSVLNEWDTLGIAGVKIDSEISKEKIEQFFKFTSEIKPNDENLESLAEKLKTNKIEAVQFLSKAKENQQGSQISERVRRVIRKSARNTFFKAMSVVEEAVVNTKDEKEINISKTRRVVHSLIDQIMRDESSLLELAAIKNYDDYTYAHSTNVCVYALTIGVRLGFDRSRLSQLGFTALFHDIGKVKLPTDLIRKPDAFDEDDWIQMQLHPILGAKTILRNLKFDMHTARAARGAFEHHINRDFTGYPLLRYKNREQNLFSKIISIVDTFDALTSGRIYLKKPLQTEEVIKKMLFQMKVKFDPFLLKIFNDIVGVYPTGSLVLLTTDEIALVLANNDKDKSRPYIKIVGNREGLLEMPIWADLSSEENNNRKIVRKIDPSRYGLDVKDFILED